jgi:glycerol kinase
MLSQGYAFCPQIEHQYPQIGQDEIDPEELWSKCVRVLRDSVRGEHCSKIIGFLLVTIQNQLKLIGFTWGGTSSRHFKHLEYD